MSKVKTPQQLGSDFQVDLEKIFKEFRTKFPMNYHRFYDTKSAGSYLPEQPGDHFVTWAGKTFLIEAKLSTVHRSLASPKALSSGMSNGQAMSQILWSRAGAHAVVIFKDHANGFVEIWPGAYVGGIRNALRARLDELKCWRRFHVEHLATNLKDLFEGGISDQFLL
mgnify:FL=1